MFSFTLNKKHIREATLFGGAALIILFILFFAVLVPVSATPSLGQGTPVPTSPPPGAPPPAVTGPDRDEAKCKMLVYPRTITLGDPFEVCWVGHKFSDVALGPDRSLTPSESSPYLRNLDDGKTLWCHSFLVPSSSNTSLNPGTYDFRCTGPGGTILATTVNVVQP